MIDAGVQFISQPPVIFTSWVEALSPLPVLTGFATLYRARIECHYTGCHWPGRFQHGPYRLCHKHHPTVPSDGRITAEHIARV